MSSENSLKMGNLQGKYLYSYPYRTLHPLHFIVFIDFSIRISDRLAKISGNYQGIGFAFCSNSNSKFALQSTDRLVEDSHFSANVIEDNH